MPPSVSSRSTRTLHLAAVLAVAAVSAYDQLPMCSSSSCSSMGQHHDRYTSPGTPRPSIPRKAAESTSSWELNTSPVLAVAHHCPVPP